MHGICLCVQYPGGVGNLFGENKLFIILGFCLVLVTPLVGMSIGKLVKFEEIVID